jgi:HK97 family phage portal protein
MWNPLNVFAARRTRPDTRPSSTVWDTVQSNSGQYVTTDRALRYAVVWACVRVLCESIAQLPWGVFRKMPAGRVRADLHPADWLLSTSPNEEMGSAVWRELMVKDAVTQGNGYSEIARDAAFRPTGLYPIRPDIVEPQRLASGELYFFVRQPQGDPIPVPAADMFHLRGMGDDLKGYSVIQYGADAIGLGIAEGATQGTFIRNDARPLGLLTPVGPVRPESKQEIEAKWKEMTGGANKFRTVVLPQEMKYTSLGIPNTDAQMLESRKFSVLDVCRLFRVPPHKVAELQFATFSNIVHQSMEFIQDSLGPWIVKMEQEADRKLTGRDRKLYTKINVNALLRGDFETRTRSYQILFDRGVFSVNDILELEDRNTIGPDGDKRFVPLNMQLLEKAGEEPEPPPPPVVPSEVPTKDQVDPPEDGKPGPIPADRVRPVVRDAVRRIRVRINSGPRGGLYSFAMTTLEPIVPLLGGPFDVERWASWFNNADNHGQKESLDEREITDRILDHTIPTQGL